MNEKQKYEKIILKISLYAGMAFVVVELLMSLWSNSQAILMDAVFAVSYTHLGFVWYALNHPECGTPFGLPLAGARILYGLYLLGTAAMFVLWVIFRKKGQMH